jgi:hypothetical protein
MYHWHLLHTLTHVLIYEENWFPYITYHSTPTILCQPPSRTNYRKTKQYFDFVYVMDLNKSFPWPNPSFYCDTPQLFNFFFFFAYVIMVLSCTVCNFLHETINIASNQRYLNIFQVTTPKPENNRLQVNQQPMIIIKFHSLLEYEIDHLQCHIPHINYRSADTFERIGSVLIERTNHTNVCNRAVPINRFLQSQFPFHKKEKKLKFTLLHRLPFLTRTMKIECIAPVWTIFFKIGYCRS